MRLSKRNTQFWNTWGTPITLAVMISGLPLLFGIWFFFGSSIENWLHHQKFNESVWKNQRIASSDLMWPPRLCMVDDLLASGRLTGMTKNQVVELIGPAERTEIFRLWYVLGPECGFMRIDSETLVVEFNVSEIVSRSYIYTD